MHEKGKAYGLYFRYPIAALQKKGFQVYYTPSEADFLSKLPNADIGWIISGGSMKGK